MPNKKNKTTKANRNKLKKKKRSVNTAFADKVFTKSRVDTNLIKKGLHTEGKLRGKPNTAVSEGGKGVMIDPNA